MEWNKLPDELLDCIFEYIPNTLKASLNTSLYKIHCNEFIQRITRNPRAYRKYLKVIIRRDDNYTLNRFMQYDGTKWLNMKRWMEEGLHPSFFHFLRYFSFRHQCMRCYHLMNGYLNEMGISYGRIQRNRIHNEW